MTEPGKKKAITRRDFVADGARLALGAMVVPPLMGAPMIVPRHVLGRGYRAPSDTLNLAIVGAGGMGMANASQLLSERIAAVCDVDMPFVERALVNRMRPRTAAPVSAEERQRRGWTEAQAREEEARRRTNEVARMEESRRLQAAYGSAARYADYREMLATERDLDGVVIGTPDHTHAVIAAAAMKAGKHVYVQKPLTFSVHEARALARLAEETRVTTQMGNQGHSMEGTRRIREVIASGVLGPVHEVHVWTDRPHRYWAQGIPRPRTEAEQAAFTRQMAEQPGDPDVPTQWNMRTVDLAVLAEMDRQRRTPPPGLHWDLFLGPAPEIEYHPAYHPFSWRGWVDFGVSAIGDMGAHLLDQPMWALDLGYPTSVSASSTAWGGGAEMPGTYPAAMTAEYEFAARGDRGPVQLFWYDGGLLPPRPRFLPDDAVVPRDGGGVFVGERGILTYETYGNNPRIYPESVAAEAERVPRTVPRVLAPPAPQVPAAPRGDADQAPGIAPSHEMNWVQAIRGEAEASSPFSYAAPLTEVMLLPIAALRMGMGRKLYYDGANMRFTNVEEANRWLTREYRAGWSL